MRRQLKLKRVGLLLLLSLLLPALSPVAIATARRELKLMAAIGDGEGRQGVSSSSETAPPGAVATAAVEGGEDDATVRRRKSEAVKTKSLRFRRTSSWKMPAASSQVNFGGRPMIPFTADYHNVQRHPPSHN